MPLKELFKMIDSPVIKDKWKEDLAQILEEGVGGLMNLAESLEKMVSPEKLENTNFSLLWFVRSRSFRFVPKARKVGGTRISPPG